MVILQRAPKVIGEAFGQGELQGFKLIVGVESTRAEQCFVDVLLLGIDRCDNMKVQDIPE